MSLSCPNLSEVERCLCWATLAHVVQRCLLKVGELLRKQVVGLRFLCPALLLANVIQSVRERPRGLRIFGIHGSDEPRRGHLATILCFQNANEVLRTFPVSKALVGAGVPEVALPLEYINPEALR
jgi:hypothetical protein